MPTPTYDLLNSTVLSTSAASITITSIPSSYRDLVAVVNAKSSSTGGSIQVRFNGDGGSNYNDIIVEASIASGTNTVSGSSRTNLITLWDQSELGTINSTIIYQIQEYSQTDKHKSVLTRVNKDGTVVGMSAGRYASTSAIDTILFTGAFAANSRVELYGIVS